MKILVVAATHAEIQPLLIKFDMPAQDFIPGTGFDVLITGAGMTASAYALGRKITTAYSLILNVGIAGSYDEKFPPGKVVNVVTDTFSEFGAQDHDRFIPGAELGLGKSTFTGQKISSLPSARGITVNRVHGNESGIAEITARVNPQTESMEGAAIFYCAEKAGIKSLQVRAISNFVEPRNRENWDIPAAVTNLNGWLIEFLGKPKF